MNKKLLLPGVVAMLLPCMTGCNDERADIRSITFINYSVNEKNN